MENLAAIGKDADDAQHTDETAIFVDSIEDVPDANRNTEVTNGGAVEAPTPTECMHLEKNSSDFL